MIWRFIIFWLVWVNLAFASIPAPMNRRQQQTNEIHYVYDRMVVIQERDALNSPKITYSRGNDLSGGLQGAGGIGGLLARTEMTAYGQNHAYYHSDKMGNITTLLSPSQQIAARYTYTPFGSTLSAIGPLAQANVYQFSSKELHPNSGLYYYGYRFFDPSTQRWLNRDPLGEEGGLNLYGFVGNNPMMYVDLYGLDWWKDWQDWSEEASAAAYGALSAMDPTGLLIIDPDDPNMVGGSYIGMVGGLFTGSCEKNAAIGAAKQIGKGAGKLVTKSTKLGRSGKQARLRELVTDPNVSSADRGWIKQEINSIERGKQANIRVPPGKNLAHRRGFESKKGYDYEYSDLQEIDLHKLQHKNEGY